jgi:hypothetical protein
LLPALRAYSARMTRSRPVLALLGLLSALCALVAFWLLLHNPTVKSTSLGGYTCSAPYDTVLFDADNVPGGEPSADADEVEARCIDVGQGRFAQGLVVGTAAVALAALTTVLTIRRQPSIKQEDVNSHASG